MPKQTDIRLVELETQIQEFAYRTPVKFGGRVVSQAIVFDVTATVESRDGRRGKGFGSMPLGNAWGWPSQTLSSEQTQDGMLRLSEAMVEQARQYREYGHPIEITTDLAEGHPQAVETIAADTPWAAEVPRLAQLLSASPLEAAIHDAYGKLLGMNSYNVLGAEFVNRDLAGYLTPEFAGEYLDQYTLRSPKPKIPLYHLVGALDPLVEDDLTSRIGDGLPETLQQWIQADGLTHLKIKLNGDDLDWDAQRVANVDAAATPIQAERGCQEWFYSLDFNERCSDVKYVLGFLDKVKALAPAALDRVQYIEQPTHRDLKAHPIPMHEAAKIKPVVIDESLIDLESLMLCREMGYSGVALKACKGQTEALLMAAAALKFNMFLCVQDLTCVGASFLHSASLSARIPTIAAIEGNGRQYCPIANAPWVPRYPSMFQITDGTVGTAVLDGPGLGF